mmetsp:Transcript_15371/g.22625  ORF Transcript_15371/g.22625 Transcript_15371/m.22625 type:complete len:167 (-) Transcript_15371:137-637(-)
MKNQHDHCVNSNNGITGLGNPKIEQSHAKHNGTNHADSSNETKCRYTEEERKERKRDSNRRSARKSAYRQKILREELLKSVSKLSEENVKLRKENILLQQRYATYKAEEEANEYLSAIIANHHTTSSAPSLCLDSTDNNNQLLHYACLEKVPSHQTQSKNLEKYNR